MARIVAERDNVITLKSPKEIAAIREAGRIVHRTLETLRQAVRPGVTTKELDDLAGECFRKFGAKSAALGYHGYPGQICVSVNDEVVHGIGGPR